MKRQHGVYAVEFAIVAGLFLVLLFAVIEIGRMMYTFSVLNEASRRAARLAVVCQTDDTDIKNMALFYGENLLLTLPSQI